MNKQIKKLVLILNLILLLLFATSCKNSRELDTFGIVVTVGLDFEDGKVIVTNEVINPLSGTDSTGAITEEGSIFVQGTGYTIEDAVADITLHFNRTPYYPHNHIIIFGEEFAKRGIGDYMDILTRDNEQRELAYMLVAKGAKASDIMGISGGMSKSSGMYLFEMIDKEVFNAETRTLRIDEFFKYFYRKKEGFILGVAESMERPQIDKDKSDTPITAINISEGAAFHDDTLIGYFTGKEMVGFNFITDQIKTASILFETPSYLADDKDLISRKGKYSTVRVFKNDTKIDVKIIDEKIHIIINTKFRGILKDNTQGLDISKPGILHEMEKACGNKVEEYIKMAMDKGQELNIDTFGIGTLVHQKYPKLWKEIKEDWRDIFPTLDYTVNVESYINAVGFTNTPPNLMKGK